MGIRTAAVTRGPLRRVIRTVGTIDRDWILTRILWLSGCEPGCNRLGCVDTMRRYIYIHGSPDSAEMGLPGSHGCIRMRNADIVELFDLVPCYTEVEITED